MTFYCLEDRPWDTNFFGRRMSKISLRDVEREGCFRSVEEAVRHARKESYEHIMTRVPSDKTEIISEMENAGFRFYGSLLSLRKDKYSDAQPNAQLRENNFLKKEDLKSVEKWAHHLFAHSYMYKDPFFPREKVDRLHEVWLENLLNAPESVILVAWSEDTISGFITVRPDTHCFEIDLFGVHPQHQRKGISQRLLALASQYILGKGPNLPLMVRTQGENIGAVNAYIRSGFQIQEHHLTLCHNLSFTKEVL